MSEVNAYNGTPAFGGSNGPAASRPSQISDALASRTAITHAILSHRVSACWNWKGLRVYAVPHGRADRIGAWGDVRRFPVHAALQCHRAPRSVVDRPRLPAVRTHHAQATARIREHGYGDAGRDGC